MGNDNLDALGRIASTLHRGASALEGPAGRAPDPPDAGASTGVVAGALAELGAQITALNSFHLASASENEGLDRVDQRGGPLRAAPDLPQNLPALEHRVRAFTGAALCSVGGVDLPLRL